MARLFSDVCTDEHYDVNDVTAFNKMLDVHAENNIEFSGLEPHNIETLLRRTKRSSPAPDYIPSWFFRNCSYEIADVISYTFTFI